MVRRKLTSRRGASVIIALVVLLVCVTAGVAALTAAGANAGRYTHARQDQQRYLAVSSAVKVVRAELAGQRFEASATLEQTSSRIDPETHDIETGSFFTLDPLAASGCAGTFASWLQSGLEGCFQATDVPDSWWSQAAVSRPAATGGVKYEGLALETDDDEPLLDQVRWELTLEEDYTLTARFWLEDDGAEYYPTVLTLPATRSETTETGRPEGTVGQKWVTTKTVTVTWEEKNATVAQE